MGTRTKLFVLRAAPLFAGLALASFLVACGSTVPPSERTPAAPSDVTATPGPGYITVAWKDNSDNESGFRVYRSARSSDVSTVQDSTLVAETGADETQAIDGTIVVSEDYVYFVTAIGDEGESGSTSTTEPTTVQSGVDLVVGTMNLDPDVTAIATAQTSMLMYFHLATGDLPPEGETATAQITGPASWNSDQAFVRTLTRAQLETGWRWDGRVADAMPGTYELTVSSAGKTFAGSFTLEALATMPIPENVVVSSALTSSVSTSWDPVAGAASYAAVLYDAPVRANATVFGAETTTTTTSTIGSLDLPSDDYFVTVYALPVDATEGIPVEPASFEISVGYSATFVPASPTNAPNPPSAVQAVAGPGFVELTWTDGSEDETGFAIYREVDTGSVATQAPTKIAEVGANETSYRDADIVLGESYVYRVAALGVEAESSGTASAAVTVEPGVDLVVGTFNRNDGTNRLGTSFVIYAFFPMDGAGAEDVSVTITGPRRWNQGQPFEPAFEAAWLEEGWTVRSTYSADALVGTYTLTVSISGGATYEAAFSLGDASHRFPAPSSVTVVDAGFDRVETEWPSTRDAESYTAALWTDGFGQLIADRTTASEATATFEGLTLEPAGHVLGVVAWPFDRGGPPPVDIEPYGMAMATQPFILGADGSFCLPEDEVIADLALAAAIREQHGLEAGPTCGQLTTLQSIDAGGRGVSSLQGLQFALSLVDLHVPHNEVDSQDLVAIRELVGLQSIHLDDNRVSTLDPLADLVGLQSLYVGGNGLTDAGALANFTELRGVSLWGSDIGSYQPLQNLTKLRYAFIGHAGASDVEYLHGLVELEMLHLNYMNLRSEEAEFISRFGLLTHLALEGNELSNIDFLAGLDQLQQLDLHWNAITDLSPIVANTGIGAGDSVNVSENFLDLSETDPSSDWPDIESLVNRGVDVLFDNQRGAISALCTDAFETVTIADPDLALHIQQILGIDRQPTCYDMAQLRELHLWDHGGIDSIAGLEYAASLIDLVANGGGISDLSPVAALGNLRLLAVPENRIADISHLSGLTQLEHLNVGGNQITSLDGLSTLDSLVTLSLGGNPIDDADISAVGGFASFAALTDLDVNQTGIADFSFLSTIPALQTAHVCCNDLKARGGAAFLSDLTNLAGLNIGWNGLDNTDLAVLADYASLDYLEISGNALTDVGALLYGKPALRHLDAGQLGITDLTWLADARFTSDLAHLGLAANALTDIGPLVDYGGWDPGDYVNIRDNPLDLSPGSDASNVIEELETSRGVHVDR